MTTLPVGNFASKIADFVSTNCRSSTFVQRLLVATLVVGGVQISSMWACANPTSNLPVEENVENSLLHWSQGTSDDADWSFAATATPTSQTGPSSPSEGGYFAFIEASGSGNPTKNFDLISPCVLFAGEGLPVVSFRYHMYGAAIGTLGLDVSTNDGSSWTNVWQQSGNKGDAWLSAEVPLKAYLNQNVKFRFRGTTGSGELGDIALDKIIIDKYIFEEPNIACEDGTDINMYYEGLDGNIPITLDITETDGLDSVRVEIVYKGGNPGNTINITDDANNTYSASRVVVGSNASVYSFNLPATSSVTYSDGNSLSNAQSILAYGFRSGQTGKQYVSQFTTIGGFKNTENVFFDLPERDGPQDLTIRVPISEVTYDNRSLNITASAGGVSQTISRTWGPGNAGFPNECCIDVLDFVLEDVPVTATFLQLEIESPQSGGQSYVLAGAVYVEVQCYDPEICVDNIDNDNDGFTDCEDLDCGQILNREFNQGLANWGQWTTGGSVINLSIDNTNRLSEANALKAEVPTASGTAWQAQVRQANLELETGKTYEIFFEAVAESQRNAVISVELSEAPYTNYFWQSYTIGTSPQVYNYQFVASESSTVTLYFGLGEEAGTAWFDNVQLKEVCTEEFVVTNSGDACIGTFAQLTATSGSSVVSWSWSGPDGFSSTEQNPSIQITDVNQGGVYTVVATLPDNSTLTGSTILTIDSDCTDICEATVQVIPANPTKCDTLNGQLEVTDYGANVYENSLDGISWYSTPHTYTNLGVGEYNVKMREVGSTVVCRTVDIQLVVINNPWYTGESVQASTGCEENDGAITLQGVLPSDEVSWIRTGGEQSWVTVSSLSPANMISNLKRGQYYVRVRRGETEFCYSERVVFVPNGGDNCPDLDLCDPIDDTTNYFPGGDFASGTTTNAPPLSPLETDYGYTLMNCGAPNDGFYAVVNNTDCNGSGGQVFNSFDVLQEDHTVGDVGGYMLLVNASFNPDIVIERIVTNLQPFTFYKFSAWVYNIQPQAPLIPNLTFLIDGVGEYSTGDIEGSGWVQVGFPFYTGNKSTATLAIRNNQTGGFGNDWLLDDIFVSVCTPNVSVAGAVEACEGDTGLILEADVTDPAAQFNKYQWQLYDEPSDSWVNLTGVLTGTYVGTDMSLDYTLPGNLPASYDGNQYRVVVTNAISNINNPEFSTASENISLEVNDKPSVSIDFNGSACLTDNSVLTAVPSGGTPEYTYAWTGPNGFESTLQDIDIPTNGNYYATVTDANGCSNSTAGFIYQAYEPFIVNLQTQVCEGDSVSLSVSGSNIQSLQWSPNAGSSTDNAVVVVPSVPSSDYLVTVTSTLGCVATAAASVDVDAAPTVSITGPSSLCIGETSTLSPSSGGYWSIVAGGSNVASVSASGVVTAVGAGTANFYFTDNVTGCRSIDPIAITVKASPEVTWTGASTLCIGETTTLSPTTGGTWVSSNSSIASISQNGTVTAIGAGSATFTFTDSATGCSASSATALVVNGKPLAIVPESLGLCIGETYGASPNTGGTWISTNTAVATISNSGLITAISAGTAAFIFTDSSTGCLSNTSNSITVHPRPTISTGGTDELCIGETFTLSPTTGGTWSSENPVVATVDNSGTVTAIAPGAVRFIFTSTDTGCQSAYSELVLVNDSPTIDLLGNDALCIGSVVTISPTTGGTWTSSDNSKATISNTGTVTAVGAGSVSFTFTHTATGCASTSTPITIFGDPITVLTGPDEICVGGSTTVLPSSGGSWTSSNSAIATISNAGVVTGMSSGNVQFTYTENASGCQASNVISVDVLSKPIVSISGDNGICVGETTSLSPSSGGYWTSSNGAVASVTSTGIVTGLSQGVVRFTFINDQGCASDETNPVIVYGIPQVFASGPTSGCVGSTLQISPTAGGVWTSSDESIATIINNGTITAVSPGTVTFIYTESASGCTSADSEDFTITAGPTLTNLGDDNLCIGGNANMTPTTGGLWESSDESVLVVDGDGTVTGVGAGTAQLTFTEYATGCAAIYQNDLTVLDPLAIDIIGSDELCVGETTTLSPSTGGFWVSDNTAVATVTSSGVVTALAQGIARFTYTSNSTGCISAPSDPVIVNDLPTISFENSDLICVGGIATLLPATGGSWTTSDPSIATVTNSGVISGVAPGTVSFSFVESSTGCQASGTLVGTVLEPTDVSVTGPTSICIGSHTTLASAGAGTWISSNPSVASVSTAGLVRGKAPGVVTFSFINSATGCTLGSETEAITVSDCFTQDFNVTLVDEPITSSVATNDNIPTGSTYGQPVLISKPNSSVPALSIAADGTYTFSSSTIGKYYYTVPVCMTPVGYGCANSLLEITVLGNIYDETSISANIDVATVYANYPDTPLEQVLIETTANDRCVNTSGCILDPTTTVLEGQPSHGTATVNGAGVITYTPDSEFIGIDTVYYQVCETAGENCAASLQIITVADDSAPNSVQAADDFVWLMTNSTTSGNVMTNDGDADGDNISITPQGTAVAPIETAVGSFYIDSDGAYSFTAADGFVGNTEIIYTVCDDQNECTQATLHILVFNDLSLKIRVYLEGALMNNNGDVSSNQRPLMRDDLRVSPYTGENVIPMIDPYTFVINSTNITNNYTKVGPGSLSKYQSITDSSTVFARTGDDAVVDWVFVELRDKNDMYATLGTRSGLVQRDGDVVDLDGVSNLRFPGVSADSFYVVVKHRSHLGAMSLLVANDAFIDFTDVTEEFFNFGTALIPDVDYTGLTFNTTVKPGYNALWAGDFDSNGRVKYENPGDDQNVLFFEVLVNQGNQLGNSNFAFGYGYYNGDYDMNARVKYANPDDDTNMLFAQVLLYPLNILALSNFNFINEQVPR